MVSHGFARNSSTDREDSKFSSGNAAAPNHSVELNASGRFHGTCRHIGTNRFFDE
jgi:hypothetical protein